MKTLSGTPKQIEAANSIRNEKLSQLESALANPVRELKEGEADRIRSTFAAVDQIWDACDWLENRRMSGASIANLTVKNGRVRLF